jgi:hypothetical protein
MRSRAHYSLQCEKEPKIEYCKRLDVSPAASSELNAEEYVNDKITSKVMFIPP